MPRKKNEEKEEELQVQAPKKKTFANQWFEDYCVNNKDDMRIVCNLTARSANEQFKLQCRKDNEEVFAVVFYGTFLSILEYIKEKQKKWNRFTIEISKSLNIGYTNNDNEDNEKVGNFMPIMEHIGINRNIVDNSPITEDQTNENYLRWKELNVKKNAEACKTIQETAYEKLKSEYKTDLRTSEAVIPVFCIFLDHITNVLKMKFKEAEGTNVSEVSMNVFGLFDIYYSFNEEDNQEIIEYQPNITMKLAFKSDDMASR